MSSKNNILKLIYKVTDDLASLLELVNTDKLALKYFETGTMTTGALPCSLDEFVEEWRALSHNIAHDHASLKDSWKQSAMFYQYLPKQRQIEFKLNNTDEEISNVIVFEDGAYMQVICVGKPNDLDFSYHVQVSNQEFTFQDYDNACDYLWENHSHVGYGE
jgi:hypothetical protein